MDHSRRATFAWCPRKYKLAYQDRLIKREEGEREADRSRGVAGHIGLATLYRGGSMEDVKRDVLEVYPTSLRPNDEAYSPTRLIQTLEEYANFYREQDRNWRVLEVEVKDKVAFGDDNHTVMLDLIAENLQGGGIYFWDHKFMDKKPDYKTWKHYDLDAQITRYSLYVKQKYGQCSGAFINAVAMGFRKRKYKDEPAGFWCEFQRQGFNRTPAQIAFWEQSEGDWENLISYACAENVWPAQLGKGCTYCSYYELCMASGDESVKEALYTTKPPREIVIEKETASGN